MEEERVELPRKLMDLFSCELLFKTKHPSPAFGKSYRQVGPVDVAHKNVLKSGASGFVGLCKHNVSLGLTGVQS